jgi:hypothetical protein
MRNLIGLVACAVVVTSTLTACSSGRGTSAGSGSASAGATQAANAWNSPQEVVAGVTAAGFPCALPSGDPNEQILTADPFTGKDLGGNALIRCGDFQVMLAKASVADAFALLVKCQQIPDSIKASPEWSAQVVVGSNFAILPADLAKGWSPNAQPGALIGKLGGTTTTFGELYDSSCAGRTATSTAPSAS